MFKIDHVGMYVNDMEKMKDFYSKYFNAKPQPPYHNPKTEFRSTFMVFSDGAKLEIMTRPDTKDTEKFMTRTGFVHMSMSLGSKEAVDEMAERMKKDGIQLVSGPRTCGDGSYMACILDPEGNQVEMKI